MRIFYFCYLDLAMSGSAPLHVRLDARKLAELGHRVLVFAPRWGHTRPEEPFEIRYLPTAPGKVLGVLTYQVSLLLWGLTLALRLRPDILYAREMSFSVVGPLLAALTRRPYVMEINGVMREEVRPGSAYRRLRLRLAELVEGLNARLAARVVTVTEEMRQTLARIHHLPLDRIVVCPNGTDEDHFRPRDATECRALLGWDPARRYVGFLGSLAPWQGLEYIVEAAPLILSQCPDAMFPVIGGGVMEQEVRRLVESRGLTAHFLFSDGRVPYGMAPVYINAFDVCLCVKQKLASGCSPLKLFDYMACAKSVVATRMAAFDIVEQYGVGRLVDPEDTAAVASACLELLGDETGCKEMGRRSRLAVERSHSWLRTAQLVERVCLGATGQRGHKPPIQVGTSRTGKVAE